MIYVYTLTQEVVTKIAKGVGKVVEEVMDKKGDDGGKDDGNKDDGGGDKPDERGGGDEDTGDSKVEYYG